jgi:hypothetical protein
MKLFTTFTVFAVSLAASHAKDTATAALRGPHLDRHLQSSFSVTSLQLVNTSTNAVVATIADGARINVPADTPLSINAVTTGAVGSVQFGYGSNAKFKVESTAPYAFCGDSGPTPTYARCAQLIAGTHTVTATPFSASGATGAPGATFKRTFTIVMTGSAPVPVPTLPVPVPPPVNAPFPTASGPSPSHSSWLAPVATPVIAVGAAHLPDGRLLMW